MSLTKWEYMYFEVCEDNTGQYMYLLQGPDNVSESTYHFYPSDTLKQEIPYLLKKMGADGGVSFPQKAAQQGAQPDAASEVFVEVGCATFGVVYSVGFAGAG